MTDATTIRYLEASISELAPKEFDAAAFYRSKLRKTASVQIVRVSRRDLDEGGGISVVVSGASREVAKLWRAWSERRTYIHANRKCVLWARHAPSASRRGRGERLTARQLGRADAPGPRRRDMCDILDFLGRDLLTVKAAFEDECRVGERKSSLRGAAPRSNDDDDIDRLVLPLAGAMRALRRAGVDLTGRSAEEWCGYWGVDGRVGFEFDDFLYLYDACARRRAWATTRERHHGGPFNAATAGSRLLLLAATLGVRVHADDCAADAKEDEEEAKAPPSPARPAEAEAPAPAAPRGARVKEAFLKHDLYGDRTMPGEMAWAALPKALAEVCDAPYGAADVARVAAALDVPPHYPVDIAQFRRIVDELDAGGARDADLRRQSWVDKDQARRRRPAILIIAPQISTGVAPRTPARAIPRAELRRLAG
ncbi:metalloendopeptidase [Aureococcus anophagefferens]|nr:metalloendopeptidase [Aureococcus anophagefferens]